jgi:hypothetical protein
MHEEADLVSEAQVTTYSTSLDALQVLRSQITLELLNVHADTADM